MRHDPASAAIVIMLRELKMHGMAHAVAELAEQGSPAFESAQPVLSQLLKAETAEREVRSLAPTNRHPLTRPPSSVVWLLVLRPLQTMLASAPASPLAPCA